MYTIGRLVQVEICAVHFSEDYVVPNIGACLRKPKVDTCTIELRPVMLSLKTLSCLKTVLTLKTVLRCHGLGLIASFVFKFTYTSTKKSVPKRLRLFCQVINRVQCIPHHFFEIRYMNWDIASL